MTIADEHAGRRVPIGDNRNARHMGGYVAGPGRVTRGDRLFRSGWFALADQEASDLVNALGIRQVIDFRTTDELERKPLAVGAADNIEIVSVPILSGNMRAYIEDTAKLAPEDVDCRAAMVRLYTDILDDARDAYVAMFAALVRGEGGALLLCSAGKDRTGMGAVLLLSALGVGREDIVQDFLLSAEIYRGHEEELARQHGYERTGHSGAQFRDVFTVLPEYIDAAWGVAERHAGSMAAFATKLVGGNAAVETLRARFTRPAA